MSQRKKISADVLPRNISKLIVTLKFDFRCNAAKIIIIYRRPTDYRNEL